MRDWYWSILIWMSWGSTSRQSESSLSLKMTSGAQQRQLFLRDCFPFFLTSFTLEINHFYFMLDILVSINIKYRNIIPRKFDAPHISIIMELATYLMPYSIISYESSLSDTLLDSVLRSSCLPPSPPPTWAEPSIAPRSYSVLMCTNQSCHDGWL